MSEHTGTSGRPFASNTKEEQSSQDNSDDDSSTSKATKVQEVSHELSPSNSDFELKSQRLGATLTASSGPHAGSSRSVQKSAASSDKMSAHMSPVHYTRTGRVSKAKKGLKVHNCHCGRSYTRAEHLRRHQKNHAKGDALICEFPDCGKLFYRPDLLHRHQERHSEIGQRSRESSTFSSHGSPPMSSPRASELPIAMPSNIAPITGSDISYTQMASPVSESLAPPSSQKMVTPMHRDSYSVPMVSVDVPAAFMPWNEPSYTQSPPYSSSSSPAPEYNQIFPVHPYGHPTSRTRASSNASIVEQPLYTPRSPISTNPYTWAQDDKITTGLAYFEPMYPVTTGGYSSSIHVMSTYGHYGAKTMMQRDEEERVILFPEQYGMGQPEHAYPFEQFLNNYWRLFHPTFPVVHRPSFEHVSQSPLLHAAMITIGGQYSIESTVRHKSRQLHDRCMKVLQKRTCEAMAEEDRTMDFQAIFLVEVMSQYRARRAAKTLSPRFGTVYHQATLKFQQRASELSEIVLSLAQPEKATVALWIHWTELTTWQHLLISCYILESQQAVHLGREPHLSMLPVSGFDLPYPVHTRVWDAKTFTTWSSSAIQCGSTPQYVFEALQSENLTPATAYQSALLIATSYNRFGISAPYDSTPSQLDISPFLDLSLATRLSFLTAKLTQVTPLRALLAVSGESWILSEKVSSPQVFSEYKNTMRRWVHQLWSNSPDNSYFNPVKEALSLSVTILQLAMNEDIDRCTLGMGSDMGIWIAALTLWTMTIAMHTRSSIAPRSMQQATWRRYTESSGPTLHLDEVNQHALVTSFEMLDHDTNSITGHVQEQDGLGIARSQTVSPIRRDSLIPASLLSHEQIAVTAKTFLAAASQLFLSDSMPRSPQHIGNLQSGCTSLLLWTKLCLKRTPLIKDEPITCSSGPSEGLGELLDSMVGSIERVLSNGWNDWGI